MLRSQCCPSLLPMWHLSSRLAHLLRASLIPTFVLARALRAAQDEEWVMTRWVNIELIHFHYAHWLYSAWQCDTIKRFTHQEKWLHSYHWKSLEICNNTYRSVDFTGSSIQVFRDIFQKDPPHCEHHFSIARLTFPFWQLCSLHHVTQLPDILPPCGGRYKYSWPDINTSYSMRYETGIKLRYCKFFVLIYHKR